MIVSITQKDIDNGEIADCHSCPIALALARELPGRHITVRSRYAYINDIKYILSTDAQNFIRNFDTRRKVNPIDVNLYSVN